MAIISTFFLLLIAVAALIVLAIANNRAGLAILVGGGAVVLVLALLVVTFVGYAVVQPHEVSVKTPATVWTGGPMNDAARAAAQELQQLSHLSPQGVQEF